MKPQISHLKKLVYSAQSPLYLTSAWSIQSNLEVAPLGLKNSHNQEDPKET